MKAKEREKRQLWFVEILIILLLIGIMSVIRFSYIHEYIPELYGDTKYIEAALVQLQWTAPKDMIFGIEKLYVAVLHMFFWFAGNKAWTVMYLQAVLQIISLLCIYGAVRKISNIVTAAAAVLAAMALPGLLWSIGEAAPGNLLLLLICLYMLLVTGHMKSAENGRYQKNLAGIWFFLTGVCGAFIITLDSIGIAAAAATVVLFFIVKSKKPESLIQKKWFQTSCYLLGITAGIAGVYLYCSNSGGILYISSDLDVFVRWGFPSLLSVTVPVLCIFVSLVKRIAFRGEEMAPEKEETKINVVDIDTIPEEEPSGIQYIENPLPVPKRHVKKVMDYAFEPTEEEMRYDVEVLDGDDFDLA